MTNSNAQVSPLTFNSKVNGDLMSSVKLKLCYKRLLLPGIAALLASSPALSAVSSRFEILHAFGSQSQPDGATAPRWLLQGKDGNLYGSALGASANNVSGILFKINISQQAPIYSNYLSLGLNDFLTFNSFIQASNGSFYGVGYGGGGAAGPEYVFKIKPSTPQPLFTNLTALPTFMSDAIATSEFLEGATANTFYATTAGGGNSYLIPQRGYVSAGMILQINAASTNPLNKIKILHKFNFINGATPIGGLIKGKDGKLYGTTCRAGTIVNNAISPNEKGVIFNYDINSTTPKLKVLYRFDGIHGGCPQGVIQGLDGALYGVTQNGGIANQGVIFKYDITKTIPVYTVLHEFKNIFAVYPRGKLVQSAGGILYGITLSGGKFGKGTVFRLNLSGLKPTYTVLHTFDGVNSGATPTLLRQGKDGNLYGIAIQEGPLGSGLVYRIKLTP